MHGTYLTETACDDTLLMALATEVAEQKGTTPLERNAGLTAFQRARVDFRTNAPRFTASFTGILEYAKYGKGFGYYGKNKTRLVVFSVADVAQ